MPSPAECYANTYLKNVRYGVSEDEARALARMAGLMGVLSSDDCHEVRVLSIDRISMADVVKLADTVALEGDNLIGRIGQTRKQS